MDQTTVTLSVFLTNTAWYTESCAGRSVCVFTEEVWSPTQITKIKEAAVRDRPV